MPPEILGALISNKLGDAGVLGGTELRCVRASDGCAAGAVGAITSLVAIGDRQTEVTPPQ
jgi:hypothetical protein